VHDGTAEGGRAACLLPPATASNPELDLGWTGLLFCFAFRVFYVKKIGLVCNLSAEEGSVCKKLDPSHG
jgi:hypothetical protein